MLINSKTKAEAIELLKSLIATPSISKTEDKTANILVDFFTKKNIPVHRHLNNIWVTTPNPNPEYPTLLLNSHHDTVKPVTGWQRDPFLPNVENRTLYGLGSNDAGASLVSLAATFLHFYDQKDIPLNLIFLASAEEEISGKNGVEAALPKLGKIDFGIVGEPTEMKMAIAEKGLMVIDGIANGKAGHAARNEGDNAIYHALRDIDFLQNLSFEKISPQLGPTKISVTQINAGTQHNVVPDKCQFVVDVRTTEAYSNTEVLFTIGNDPDFDLQLAKFDVQGTLAHIKMLKSIDLLTAEELANLEIALAEITELIEQNKFEIEPGIEDVHSQVELLLTRKLGDTGKKIHSGRSRNDQVMVDLRFGAYAESLVDDLTLLSSVYKINNQNPLGSAAGYGSSFPLDRKMTTDLLGFQDLANYQTSLRRVAVSCHIKRIQMFLN